MQLLKGFIHAGVGFLIIQLNELSLLPRVGPANSLVHYVILGWNRFFSLRSLLYLVTRCLFRSPQEKSHGGHS